MVVGYDKEEEAKKSEKSKYDWLAFIVGNGDGELDSKHIENEHIRIHSKTPDYTKGFTINSRNNKHGSLFLLSSPDGQEYDLSNSKSGGLGQFSGNMEYLYGFYTDAQGNVTVDIRDMEAFQKHYQKEAADGKRIIVKTKYEGVMVLNKNGELEPASAELAAKFGKVGEAREEAGKLATLAKYCDVKGSLPCSQADIVAGDLTVSTGRHNERQPNAQLGG